MRFFHYLILFISLSVSAQQGGMWIPSLLKGMNETEMKQLGGKLSAEDIYSVNQSSLKDAIAHFNGGCTSEVISPKGLLLTNHHCGFGEIQSHSSLENDYLKEGFWAKNLAEELPNEDLEVTFIVKIVDVTSQVLAGVTENLSVQEAQKLTQKNTSSVSKAYTEKEAWQEVMIRPFFNGNQYFLFVTETFKDVRLVGAPPSSIGKFGSDTDNWVFPRHTGDFSLFRIYADKDNKPAEYSKDNVPYTPKHYLPVSLDGIEEGDFTMVFGFPGRTNEYLPSVAIEQIVTKVNPSNIKIREAALKVIDNAMKADDEVRIMYASKQARIANYWKKWIGENQGITKSNAIAKKKKLESLFSQKIKEKGLANKYGNLLTQFNTLYASFEASAVKRSNFVEIFFRNNELMSMMFRLYQLEQSASQGSTVFNKRRDFVTAQLTRIHKNYNATVDRKVFDAVIKLYDTSVKESSFYEYTAFTNLSNALKAIKGSAKEVTEKLNADKAYQFAKPYIAEFYNEIEPNYQLQNQEIAKVQKQYMKALMEVLPSDKYYPDANSTLRVTYGQVKGYAPRDAVYYNPVTYLDGVIEKYVPNDYEFDVPKKLLELHQSKNYGPYADANGKVPVCFIGTNHTTGGNSGSPALDAEGNLIGLNFDRVWEGTMSDMNYDPNICRNIMVDIRYVLFIVDKYAGATHLVEEMKLVHPKKK